MKVEEQHPEVADYTSLEHLTSQRSGPGIIMLSLPLRLLHMNRRAWELLREISHSDSVGVANGLLPPVLIEICAQIDKDLTTRTGAKDWEQFEVRRLAGSPKEPILFRATALPGDDAKKSAQILVVLEKVGRRKVWGNGANGGNRTNGHAKERFHLTARELEVCEHLSRGLTNKEISSALKITEPTVKAHIRNIMEKTGSTTRTGVVSQVLGA